MENSHERACPICNKTMKYSDKIDMKWRCENECFYESRSSFGNVTIFIFDKKFETSIEDHSMAWQKFDLDVEAEIAHWKENDAYLAEILERKDKPKFNAHQIFEEIGLAVINQNAVVNVKNFFTLKKK